jgi:hypothetical protein
MLSEKVYHITGSDISVLKITTDIYIARCRLCGKSTKSLSFKKALAGLKLHIQKAHHRKPVVDIEV